MKIHDVVQNSTEWHQLRSGVPTASEFDNLLTPKWEIRTGKTPRDYLHRKVANRIMGYSPEELSSFSMQNGQLLEKEALPWVDFALGHKINRVGFCTTDDGSAGCSPDGLIAEDGGIEIKCPEPHTHVAYLLGGRVPQDYLAQVHGCMYVTGRLWWLFVSYSRFLPKLVVRVERDEAIIKIIHETVTKFCGALDAATERVRGMMENEHQLKP